MSPSATVEISASIHWYVVMIANTRTTRRASIKKRTMLWVTNSCIGPVDCRRDSVSATPRLSCQLSCSEKSFEMTRSIISLAAIAERLS